VIGVLANCGVKMKGKKGDKSFDFKILASVSIVGIPVFLGCLVLYLFLGKFSLSWHVFFFL
jgi:hypothetical protein